MSENEGKTDLRNQQRTTADARLYSNHEQSLRIKDRYKSTRNGRWLVSFGQYKGKSGQIGGRLRVNLGQYRV